MNEGHLPHLLPSPIQKLERAIRDIQQELEDINTRTHTFEALLAAQISDLIIEEQELAYLYKQQKSAKKNKRNEQKMRGKNYRPLPEPQRAPPRPESQKDLGEEREKKRLYREALLHVHPDKFSMEPDKIAMATEITTKLIALFQADDLEALQAYHAHIFSGNTLLAPPHVQTTITGSGMDYLKGELEKLQKALEAARNKHTYKVLTEYEDPMLFLAELKAYYRDRIGKLKRRTRTA